MRLDVINVGDGACTLMRLSHESMVVDCGSWRDATGHASAMLLEAAIGSRGVAPTTVVVTHFDRDHWLGLKALAARKVLQPPSRPVQVIFPRLPRAARAVRRMLLAYIVLETSPWGNADNLIGEWRAYASRVVSRPVSQGQSFLALGQRWNVLWPPRVIDERVSKRFNQVAREGEELAEVYPPLREALDRVYQYDFLEDDQDPKGWGTDQLAETNVQDSSDERGYLVDEERNPGLQASTAYPDADDELQRRLGDHRRAAQQINNELSLVLENEQRTILNLGDLEGWGLNRFLKVARHQLFYHLVFAPHHGTQRPGTRMAHRFPTSWVTVAQNGTGHLGRTRRDFLSQHTDVLLNTAEVGSISFPRRWPSPWTPPG